MDENETKAICNLAETCCASLSLDGLLGLSNLPRKPSSAASAILDLSATLTYGDIRGLPALRSNIAALYSDHGGAPVSPEAILTTPGAIAAKFLIFYALVGPGDHVICQYPTYQQLYSVPASLGADVSLWKGRPEHNWIP